VRTQRSFAAGATETAEISPCLRPTARRLLRVLEAAQEFHHGLLGFRALEFCESSSVGVHRSEFIVLSSSF
jgi:hypothetical protein